MRAIIYVGMAGLLLIGAAWALAAMEGSSPDGKVRDVCFTDNRVDQNDQIEACTTIINSPRFSAEDITNAYGARALANAVLRRYANASTDADEAISRSPDARNFVNRCGVNLFLRRYQKAIEDCTAALYSRHGAEDSNVAGIYALKSMAYEGERQYARAISNADQAVVLDPKNALAFAIRCDVHDIQDESSAALADCDKAITLNENEEAGFVARAFVNLKRGAYPDAERDFDAALKLDTSIPVALYGRGLVARHQGNSAAAEVDFATAKRLDDHVTEDIAEYGLKP